MASFLIKKIEVNQKIIKFDNDMEGYMFRPNLNMAKIDTITLYNETMISNILSKKLQKNFERLAMITYDIITSNDDEDGTSDTTIALDEIVRLKGLLINKYNKYLSKELEKEYLKKLLLLEKELKSKLLLYKAYNEILSSEKGHSR